MPAPVLEADDYRRIVESAPILIWRSDATGGCDYFNARWLEFTGSTLEQQRGDGWARWVHPDDVDRCVATYRRAFALREPFRMDYRLRRFDDVYRLIEDRGIPFWCADGAFGGYIGSCLDVTERVELEQARRRAQELELQQLRGLLPICPHCKRIREAAGGWQTIEAYVQSHSAASFSPAVCPHCLDTYFRGG